MELDISKKKPPRMWPRVLLIVLVVGSAGGAWLYSVWDAEPQPLCVYPSGLPNFDSADVDGLEAALAVQRKADAERDRKCVRDTLEYSDNGQTKTYR